MPALSERFEMRLDQNTLQAVDSWRSKRPGVPSRAEAIRQLIERALATSTEVHFTPGDRLIIQMVSELLKQQPKKKTDYSVDPAFIEEAVNGGHFWALGWKYPGIFDNKPDDAGVVTETVDIMQMWDHLSFAFENLDDSEQDRVRKAASLEANDEIAFPGFDANNDDHYGVACFLIDKLDKFQRYKGANLNSHSRGTLEMHRRMMAIYKPITSKLFGGQLTGDQILSILAEGTHASRC